MAGGGSEYELALGGPESRLELEAWLELEDDDDDDSAPGMIGIGRRGLFPPIGHELDRIHAPHSCEASSYTSVPQPGQHTSEFLFIANFCELFKVN